MYMYNWFININYVYQALIATLFTYLVTAFRQAFMGGDIITANHGIYTIVFWLITIILFVWGNHVFNKNKKDFSDVL